MDTSGEANPPAVEAERRSWKGRLFWAGAAVTIMTLLLLCAALVFVAGRS